MNHEITWKKLQQEKQIIKIREIVYLVFFMIIFLIGFGLAGKVDVLPYK